MKSLDSSLQELKDALSEAGESPVFVKFTAAWCGPCKRIQPEFEALSKEYASAKFYIVDVDKNQDAGEYYNISSLPTFICFKDGVKVDKTTGANVDKLKELVKKIMGSNK